MVIIKCPKCQGTGHITKTNSMDFGLAGIIFTLGIANVLDAICSEEWQEECPKCLGNGYLACELRNIN